MIAMVEWLVTPRCLVLSFRDTLLLNRARFTAAKAFGAAQHQCRTSFRLLFRHSPGVTPYQRLKAWLNVLCSRYPR